MKLRSLRMLSLYDDELKTFWNEEIRPLIKYYLSEILENPETELTESLITEILTMLLEDNDFDGILFNNKGSYETFMFDTLNQFTKQYLLPLLTN